LHIQTSLATDFDCSELHVLMEAVQAFLKMAKLTNKGQFERYTVRNLQKFASVHELKQFLLENYSEIRKYRVFPVMFKNNHSLIMQMQHCMNNSQKSLGSHNLLFIAELLCGRRPQEWSPIPILRGVL